MGKIRYTMRLYKNHDRDLISILENYHDSLAMLAHISLTAFVEGKEIVLKPIKKREKPLAIGDWEILKQIVLDEDEDADVLSFLSKLAGGSINTVLKGILRMYLCMPMCEGDLIYPEDYADYLPIILAMHMGRQAVTVDDAKEWYKGSKSQRRRVKEAGSIRSDEKYSREDGSRGQN